MGSFTIFHWVIAFAMIAGTIFVFAIVISSFRRNVAPPKRQASSNVRLEELTDLRAKKLISEEEFERRRAEILREH